MDPTVEEPSNGGDSPAATRPRCRFVVTGFGPFRGVPDNPTSALVRRLRAVNDGAALRSSGGSDVRETHVLETSAESVREEIDALYGRARTSENDSGDGAGDPAAGADADGAGDDGANGGGGADGADGAKDVVVFLHLGVNYRGTRFQIEQCAYNDATFRVPDERGYQPTGECILEGDETASRGWGECVTTTLDVQHICNEMQKHNETVVSKDPGRFVCNYTYCLSLDRCHSANMVRNNGKGEVCHSLFIHVPPFDVVSEEEQLDFVLKVMQTIEQQLCT